MTRAAWDRSCFQMGITSRAEIQAMSLQEFLLRMQAEEQRERNAIRRHLLTVNAILGVVGEGPITLRDLTGAASAGPTDTDRKEYEALKGRYPRFVTDQTL